MIAATAFLAAAAVASAFSPLIASASVDAYRAALADVKRGKVMQANAVFDGLLMSRQVKIAVDLSTAPRGREEDYLEGMYDAFDIWENALGETLFVMAEPDEKADINVRFVRDITKGGDVQGAIEANRRFFWGRGRSGYELTGTIQIKSNAMGRALSGTEAGRVMAHELGHLLGLDDRYASRGIMGAFRPGEGRVRPSDAEVEAVMEFRDELRSGLRMSANR